MAKTLKIEQVRAASQTTTKQREVLKSLGLRGRGSIVFRSDLRAIRGMLNKVHHLIRAEQIDGPVQMADQAKNSKKTKTFEIKRAN